jgi:hypothetical protein
LTDPSGWTTSGFPVTPANAFNIVSNSASIASPAGNVFFRLYNP